MFYIIEIRISISFYSSAFESGIDRTNEITIGRISYKNVNQFEKYCEFIIALLRLSHFYESDSCDNAWCDLDKIVSYNSI